MNDCLGSAAQGRSERRERSEGELITATGKAAGTNLRLYFDDEPGASITINGCDIAKFPVEIPSVLLYKHEHYNTTQAVHFIIR